MIFFKKLFKKADNKTKQSVLRKLKSKIKKEAIDRINTRKVKLR